MDQNKIISAAWLIERELHEASRKCKELNEREILPIENKIGTAIIRTRQLIEMAKEQKRTV